MARTTWKLSTTNSYVIVSYLNKKILQSSRTDTHLNAHSNNKKNDYKNCCLNWVGKAVELAAWVSLQMTGDTMKRELHDFLASLQCGGVHHHEGTERETKPDIIMMYNLSFFFVSVILCYIFNWCIWKYIYCILKSGCGEIYLTLYYLSKKFSPVVFNLVGNCKVVF